MSFLYGPQEMAEMTAAGVGDCPKRPLPLPSDAPAFSPCAESPFREPLARAYEARGYLRADEAVRQLPRT